MPNPAKMPPAASSAATPGPWYAEGLAGNRQIVSTTGSIIARFPAWPGNEAEREANIALIKTAPLLRDALRAMMERAKAGQAPEFDDMNLAASALYQAGR